MGARSVARGPGRTFPYTVRVQARTPRIVDILRDFIEVHRSVRDLVERHRSGSLHFRHVTSLVGEDEGSVLFRLKERCHAVFRQDQDGARQPTHREALFDLAVGSLFHEAMKLREDLYQNEVYAPRVRIMREGAGEESKALFDEFERMLAGVAERLEKGVREVDTVVRRTADQLRLLLSESGDDGTAARFLTERNADVEAVFDVPLLVLLEQMHGSAPAGLERAGCSYLASGYFELAAERFAEASRLERAGPSVEALLDYALGMQAYLRRDYPRTLEKLSRWAASEAAPDRPELRALARDAVSRLGQLAERPGRDAIARDADQLLERLDATALHHPARSTPRTRG